MSNKQCAELEIWAPIPNEHFAEGDVWSTLPNAECVEEQIWPLIRNEDAVEQASYSSISNEQSAEQEIWPPNACAWSPLPNDESVHGLVGCERQSDSEFGDRELRSSEAVTLSSCVVPPST